MNRTSDRAYDRLVNAVQEFKDAMVSELDDAVDDSEKAEKKVKELDSELEKLIEERDELRNQVQTLESNKVDLQNEVDDLQNELNRALALT